MCAGTHNGGILLYVCWRTDQPRSNAYGDVL